MGERATGLTAVSTPESVRAVVSEPGHAGVASTSTREATRQLEGDIASLREDLGALVAELDRRRHELTDVKGQLRRHAGAAALTGVALIAAARGVVFLRALRRRRRARAQRAAAEQTVPRTIVAAAATAALATLVRRVFELLTRAALARLGVETPHSPMTAGSAQWPASTGNGRRALNSLLRSYP